MVAHCRSISGENGNNGHHKGCQSCKFSAPPITYDSVQFNLSFVDIKGYLDLWVVDRCIVEPDY